MKFGIVFFPTSNAGRDPDSPSLTIFGLDRVAFQILADDRGQMLRMLDRTVSNMDSA